MLVNDKIWMAQGEDPCFLLLGQANRHGLIAGASGTGKTVTLKVMAEGFSQAGVPVFMADVKGDVTGMAEAGWMTDFIRKRCQDTFRLEPDQVSFVGCPVRVWDMLGDAGLPVRITISDMGPVLLSRLLGLTDVQEGVLNIVFRVADDNGLLLIDLKDLRSMLAYVSEHAKEYQTTYGNVSAATVGAIQRALMVVEDQGGDVFFGEPNLDLADWFCRASDGRGYVNVLNAARLIQTPQIYAMFLLWMLSSLFDTLPEVGDPDKPAFVFFFDEAHLLFDGMPKALQDKLVQVVKLIRSKGVGVYFITQSPSDIPDEVLAQLSNRVQHGLRAYTPAEQRAVRAAAESFRANPAFDSVQALQEVGTGEALVSFLDEEGAPCVVQRAKVLFPQCSMAAASDAMMLQVQEAQADLMGKYGDAVDRQSAFEQIQDQKANDEASARLAAEREALEREKAEFEAKRQAEADAAAKQREKDDAKAAAAAQRELERQRRQAERDAQAALKRQQREAERVAREEARRREQLSKQAQRVVGSLLGTFGREATRQLTRGLFGALRR
ncbi:helicase HerA-like domain-containing protein [Olsenella sp. HMSC062G07]|uniref:helicase HerA-like domain-containing protein n=1 Tax=Olsenella sp. HMSC062G07 TaxID=1739330 RepID=UPI0008A55AC8|nr:helicase HerA-like domain-containing protein [Olsenella sp. HMSC062G07]OFK23531.1 ATP-binding protein [Olsenella sp. HMSC062G07]